MRAVDFEVSRYAGDGKREVRALIVADSTPATLPTTGANVEGLADTDVFAPMSILYVVGAAETKVYVANEQGQFVAQ